MTVQLPISYDTLLTLVEQLPEDQQNQLIHHVRVTQTEKKIGEPAPVSKQDAEPPYSEWAFQRGAEYVEPYRSPSRAELLDEVESLRSQPVQPGDSLLGKYRNAAADDLSAATFHAEMHAISSEWEQELDEFESDTN